MNFCQLRKEHSGLCDWRNLQKGALRNKKRPKRKHFLLNVLYPVIYRTPLKIKPEDFHNVSAFRNEGSSLTSNEAGSISDAKLAKFFGLKKRRRKSQSSVMPSAMPPRFSRHGTPGESPISKNPSRMVSCPRSVWQGCRLWSRKTSTHVFRSCRKLRHDTQPGLRRK